MRILLALLCIASLLSTAFALAGEGKEEQKQSEAFQNVLEKKSSILSARQALKNSESSYTQRLSRWKELTASEQLSTHEAPQTHYIFWDTDSQGAPSYSAPQPNKWGVVPLSEIESYKSGKNYQFGTLGSFSKYDFDPEAEKLELRRTTQYYLKERARYAKMQINAAKEAVKAEGLEKEFSMAELDRLYNSIDNAEYDIAFGVQGWEIAHAASELKNDVDYSKALVQKIYSRAAKKSMERLLDEAESSAEQDKYLWNAQSLYEKISLYFEKEKADQFLHNIKMAFRNLA